MEIYDKILSLVGASKKNFEPGASELTKMSEWFNDLDPTLVNKITNSLTSTVYQKGEFLFREDLPGDGLYIIVEGNATIKSGSEVLDIAGPGTVIGEIANLMNVPRTATVTACEQLKALRLSSKSIAKLMKESAGIGQRLWKIAGSRFVINYLIKTSPYRTWDKERLKSWVEAGEVLFLKDEESIELVNLTGVLLSGEVFITSRNNPIAAPAILFAPVVYVRRKAIIYICKKSG